MKLVLVPIVALALASPCAAQQPDNSAPAKLSNPEAPSAQQKSGTAPGGTGSTGWSGSYVKKPESDKPAQMNTDQPPVASGVDLQGPPQSSEASKTPE